MNLYNYEKLINSNPIHIATIAENNKPNISVASDVRVIDNNKIIVSINEMNNTQKNIKINPNVALTVFNNEWIGLRMFGIANFYTEGKYYYFCKDTFFGNNEVTPFGAIEPKGAMVITIDKIEELK